MPGPPTLSVVIPATDAPPTLERCLAAIDRADTPPDEVIVIDGPADLGVCEARNRGVARATGDVVVFVDADVEVHPDVFTRFRDAFASEPDLVGLHGSYDDAPSDRGTVSVFRNLLHHHVHQANPGPTETFWTGLGGLRRTAFLEVGGFDGDRYPRPSVEDIDLGQRLWAGGAKMRLAPEIQGTHLKRWGLASMVWTDFARRGVPWLLLQLRSRRLSSALNCGWRHRLSALVCAVGVASMAFGRVLAAAACIALLVSLNRPFHALLVRELGLLRGGVAIGLHALHHLVALAAVPAALVVALVSITTPRRTAAAGTSEGVATSADPRPVGRT